MTSERDSGFLAPSDIAELAGVSRAAVSNWRRRELDFPAPTGGTKANPLFDRAEVERWLEGRRPQRVRAERVPAGLALWSVMNGYRRDIPMHTMQTLALSVLCARKLSAISALGEDFRREASQGRFLQAAAALADPPDADERWRQLVWVDLESLSGRRLAPFAVELVGVVDTMAIGELAKAADFVLNRVTSTEGRAAGEHGAVNSRMSRLLAEVASTDETRTAALVYDPACGIGEALIQFWKRSPHPDRLHLYGAEIDEDYARICRQRCFLHGATATVVCFDVLERDLMPDLRADIVMAEPPFGSEMPPGFSLADPRWDVAGLPPRADADTAWIQHVVSHLTPDGKGLVVTGLGATYTPGSTAIRRSLVQRGCVEAVVVLPRKLLSYSPVQTSLWILRPADQPVAPEEIMFIDASSRSPNDPMDLHLLSRPDWVGHHLDLPSASIEVSEILGDDQLRLDPRYWTRVSADPEEVVDRYRTAVALLDRVVKAIAETDYEIQSLPSASRTITIGELEKQGALTIVRSQPLPAISAEEREALGENWQRRLRERRLRERRWDADSYDPRVATQSLIRQGLPDVAPERPRSNDAMYADAARYTDPGDILVISGHAVVDEHGGWVPGVGVTRLIVDPRQLDPQYVADCLNSSWNQRSEQTSAATVPLRESEIPLIPLHDQLRMASENRGARELASTGRLLAEAADELVSVRLDAIRHNVELGAASFRLHKAHSRPGER